MRKLMIVGLLAALVAAVGALTATPAGAKQRSLNGRIAFARYDPALGDTVPYTINPDGTHEQQLIPGPPVAAEIPTWSPDGTKVDVQPGPPYSAWIVNADTGNVVQLLMPSLLFTFCNVWSPDSERLACEAGFTNPSLQGVWTIRSSDGGGLTQVTSNPGGDDQPGSYSPDGRRLVFVRQDPSRPANAQVALFVVNADGTGLRRITPWGLPDFDVSSWSPDGKKILFGGNGSLYVVHPDGTGLHQIRLATRDLSRAFQPGWSPDGEKIVFAAVAKESNQEDIYTATAEGGDVEHVTNTPGYEEWPNWGTHPLAH